MAAFAAPGSYHQNRHPFFGWSMVLLALLIRLPLAVTVAVGGIMVLFHNVLDGISASSFGPAAWLWTARTTSMSATQLTPRSGR